MIIKRQRNFSWEQGENGTWHYSPKGRELKFMYMRDPDINEDSIEESEPIEDEETTDLEESERDYSDIFKYKYFAKSVDTLHKESIKPGDDVFHHYTTPSAGESIVRSGTFKPNQHGTVSAFHSLDDKIVEANERGVSLKDIFESTKKRKDTYR